MKFLYWLIPIAIIAGILLLRWQRDPPQTRQEQIEESAVEDGSPGRPVFRVPDAAETAVRARGAWVAHTPLGKDRRRAVGEAVSVGKMSTRHEVPAIFAVFDEWMGGHLAASASERPARLEEGRALLAERQKLWPDLARSDPEAALLFAPSPAARAVLPRDMAALLEQIVSGEGFYGVKAICNHDPAAEHGAGCRIEHEVFIDGRSYQAMIYGTRTQRLTEESASIYGVALDGLMALHEDDVVIMPADAGQLALIYRGKTTLVSETRLEATIHSLLNP